MFFSKYLIEMITIYTALHDPLLIKDWSHYLLVPIKESSPVLQPVVDVEEALVSGTSQEELPH